MGDFRSGGRSSFGGGRDRGRGGFGGGRSSGGFGGARRSFGGGRDRERTEMYDAICSKCGKSCQLPFKPRGDKPVYCSACFETEGQTSPRQSSSSNSGAMSSEQFNKLNAKLDKIIAILEELEIISDEDEELDEIASDTDDEDETVIEIKPDKVEDEEDFDEDEDEDFEEESPKK